MIKVESSMEVMNKKLDELLARSKQPVAAKSSSQALDNKNTEVKDWFRSAISYAGSVIGEMSAQSACGDSDSVVIERAVLSPNISRLLHHTESTRRPLAEIPREMPSDPPRYSEALRAVVPVPTRPQPEARPSHEIRVDEGGGHNDQNRTSSRDTPTDRPQSVIVNELFSSLVESRGWNRFPPEILQKFHGFSLAQKWHLIDQDPQQQKQLEIVTKQAIQAQLRRASNKRAAVSPANVPENFKKVSWDLQAKPKPKPKIVPTTYAAYHSKRRVDGKIGRLSYPEKQLIREIDGLDGECSLEHQLCDVLTSKQLHAVYDIYRRVVQKETDTSVEWVVMQVRSHARQRHVFLVDTRLVSYVDVFLRRASKDGSSSMEFECGARKSIRIVDEY